MKRDYFRHKSSVVSKKANVGKGTKIWHFCHVMKGADIGTDCILGQNVFIAEDVSIGNKVKIQNNVSVYKGVVCEDEVFLGPSMVFTNVKNPRSKINRKSEFQQTIVRKGASIGANATILSGIELGEYCFIGAGCVITKDVPAYAVMVGNPGKQIGWMSTHGVQLNFSGGKAYCAESGEIYQFHNGKVKQI